MKDKVLFIYRHGAIKNIISTDGKIIGPTDFLWGMNCLDKDKFEIKFVNAPREEKRRRLRKLSWLIEFPFAKIVRIGLPIEIYWLFKTEIEWADKIICVNDQISLGVLFWRLLGKLKNKKIYCIIMSLPERIKYFYWCRPAVWLISKLLRQADRVLTLSDFVKKDLSRYYQVAEHKLKTFYFGIDTDFWQPLPGNKEGDFILSIGNDMNRDYGTLVDALPDNIKLKLVTNKRIKYINKKVEILFGISDEGVRLLYNQARLVVIPSIKLKNESSGLSCTLQAMACGKAVIASDAPPLRELFADKLDCLFYKPGDAGNLADKISVLFRDNELRERVAKSGYQKVIKKYTCQNMGKSLEYCILESN